MKNKNKKNEESVFLKTPLRDEEGRFASRWSWYGIKKTLKKIGLVTLAAVIALEVVSIAYIYERAMASFEPKIITVYAQTPEDCDYSWIDNTVKKDILEVACERGFKDLKMLFYLAQNESGFDPDETNINIHKNGSVTVDRGLFQLNDYWHAEIPNWCAFDARCATNETISILNQDGNCHQWSVCPQ